MENKEIKTKVANYYHHVDNGGLDFEITSISDYQNVSLEISTQYYDYPSVETKVYIGSVKHDNPIVILEGIAKACFSAIEKLKSQ